MLRVRVRTLGTPQDGWEWAGEVMGLLLQLLLIFLWFLPLLVMVAFPEKVDPADAFAALLGTTMVFSWMVVR